jgi:hypothetical protein
MCAAARLISQAKEQLTRNSAHFNVTNARKLLAQAEQVLGAARREIARPLFPTTYAAFALSKNRDAVAAYVSNVLSDNPSGFPRLESVMLWLSGWCEDLHNKPNFATLVWFAGSVVTAVKSHVSRLRGKGYSGQLEPVIQLLRVIARNLSAHSSYDGRIIGGQALISLLLLHISHPDAAFRLGINNAELGPQIILHAAMEMGGVSDVDLLRMLLALAWLTYLDFDGAESVMSNVQRHWKDEMQELIQGAGKHILAPCAAMLNTGLENMHEKVWKILVIISHLRNAVNMPHSLKRIQDFTVAVSHLVKQQMGTSAKSMLAYAGQVTSATNMLTNLAEQMMDKDTGQIHAIGGQFLSAYTCLAVWPHTADKERDQANARHIAIITSWLTWDEDKLKQAKLWNRPEWCPSLFSHCIASELALADKPLLSILSARSRALKMANKHEGFVDAVREQLGPARLAQLLSLHPWPGVESFHRELSARKPLPGTVASSIAQHSKKRDYACTVDDEVDIDLSNIVDTDDGAASAGASNADERGSSAGDDKRQRTAED